MSLADWLADVLSRLPCLLPRLLHSCVVLPCPAAAGDPPHAQPPGQQHPVRQQRQLHRVGSQLHRRRQQHPAGDPQQLPLPAPYQQAQDQLPHSRQRRPGRRPLSSNGGQGRRRRPLSSRCCAALRGLWGCGWVFLGGGRGREEGFKTGGGSQVVTGTCARLAGWGQGFREGGKEGESVVLMTGWRV